MLSNAKNIETLHTEAHAFMISVSLRGEDESREEKSLFVFSSRKKRPFPKAQREHKSAPLGLKDVP